MQRNIIILLLLAVCSANAWAQQGSNKIINPYHKNYYDSLKEEKYPYHLPLLGAKASKKGYDMPLPVGIMGTFYLQNSQILIPSIRVGNNPDVNLNLDTIIEFGDIQNTAVNEGLRADAWILPFLNVYGIFGVLQTKTVVPVVAPVTFTTTQKFTGYSYGGGVTLAGGIGPIFCIWDHNLTWADMEQLEKPVLSYNMSLRLGHTFVDPRKATRNFGFWMGTSFQHLDLSTRGSVKLSDVFSPDADKIDRIKQQLETWYNGLGPAQKIAAQELYDAISSHINGNPSDASIYYDLQKELKSPWNFMIGVQYQHNKTWQYRIEVGGITTRTSILVTANYRLGI